MKKGEKSGFFYRIQTGAIIVRNKEEAPGNSWPNLMSELSHFVTLKYLTRPVFFGPFVAAVPFCTTNQYTPCRLL